MGLFKQTVSVLDASGATVETHEAWVDTGSTYTWLPRSVFESLGVQATEQRETRAVAQMRISLGGPSFYTYCAVAEEGEELLLGAVALEEAGLAVDSVNRRLVPAAGYALTAIESAENST